MNELFELLLPTFLSVVPIILGYAGVKIGTYFKIKGSNELQEKIDNIIKSSVIYVEQVTGVDLGYEAQEKFKFAKERAILLLSGAGIEVSEEYLDTLIEVFVNGLK